MTRLRPQLESLTADLSWSARLITKLDFLSSEPCALSSVTDFSEL
jgi:hypothetical protein